MAKKAPSPTNPSNINPLSAERKRISNRIRKLTRRIKSLKRRLNTLAPINSLPPELLIRIFLSLQSSFREGSPADYYRWTTINHVCRSWRVLVLETKQLWNLVSYDTKTAVSPWSSVSINRSLPLGLNIAIKFDLVGKHTTFLDDISAQSQRIRTMDVKAVGSSTSDTNTAKRLRALIDWLGTKLELPMLEEFNLRGNHQYISQRPRSHLAHPILFNSTAPSLKSLQISSLNVGLQALPFHGITNLKLTYAVGHCGEISFHALFDVLRNTQLRTLDLQDAIFEDPAANDAETESPMPIALTSLSSFTLFAPTHHCQKLLSSIKLPYSCCTSITGRLSSNPSDPHTHQITFSDFFNSLIPYFSKDPTDFIGLDINVGKQLLDLSLRRQGDYNDQEWKHEVAVSICLYSLSDKPEPSRWTLPSLTSSTFSKIWALFFMGSHLPPTLSVADLVSASSILPLLEEIEFANTFVPELAKEVYDNLESFPRLVYMKVDVGQPRESYLQELEKGLCSHKEAGMDELRVRLYGKGGWATEKPFAEQLERLKKIPCRIEPRSV